jgi:hypothetical protein
MAAQRESDTPDPITKSATEARQGIEIHRMRYVLLFSTAAAIVLLLVAYLVLVNHSG